MLLTLRIKNLALVADLSLEFGPGFNVITGETGAGKSILIGALNLLLGQRADRNAIRAGCDSCSVEAVFDISQLRAPLPALLDQNGLEPCEDAHLVLKRTFTGTGSNRQFVNGSPTTLQTLATIGEWLVDIHGPHDHQSLLYPARQLAILDAFGGLTDQRDAFADLIRKYHALQDEKSALIVDEQTFAQQLDLLRFQASEIDAAKLRPDEESELAEEYQRSSNAARILETVQSALGVLGEDETALTTQAGRLGRLLTELNRVDGSTAPFIAMHDQLVEQLRELQTGLSRYADRVEVDPARLQELEERLNLLQSLKRKYGATVDAVIAFGKQARKKLQALEERDLTVERIHRDIDALVAQLAKAAKDLTVQRNKVIPKLCRAASKHLSELGFKQAQFAIAIKTEALPPRPAGQLPLTGLDTIEFQFAPNPGEPARPLRAIASSGELARVMLALKTVLAAQDQVPVLVFDEVDANVGGETAQVVGEKMRQIGTQRQVLCITHLAPVAAAAAAHYLVSKQVRDGRTLSEIELLDSKERVTEIARMLGGQSDPARKHAESLLAGA